MSAAVKGWDPLRRIKEAAAGPPAPSVVYFIRCGDFVKIGKANDVRARMEGLQTGNPYTLTLLGTIPGGMLEERNYHTAFHESRHRGEWFRITDELVIGLATLGIHVEAGERA